VRACSTGYVILDPRDARIAALEAELAVKEARINELEQQVMGFERQVGELRELLGRGSHNSHRPPSSDPPGKSGKRGRKGKRSSGRKRGGQPGHVGHRRQQLPPEQVDRVVDVFPPECERCETSLPQIQDPHATRHQHTELPPVRPHTTEFRLHAVTCPRCKHETRAPYDPQTIPASPFGPRLMATIGLLTGVHHLSRREALDLLCNLCGVRLSLGALSSIEARVSDAVEPAVEEAWQRVGESDIKHTDGTPWLQAGVVLALWTIASAVATVFKIVANNGKETLKPLYGALVGILVSDRTKSLSFWVMGARQICWAHLIRKFVSFAERDGPAAAFGCELLDYTGLVFEYWHGYRDGKLTRAQLEAQVAPVREHFENTLHRAVAAGIERLSGSCKDILAHQPALWTFVEHEGVEPTNNHAERELRAFVLWRRRSFGSQSERGNRFAERLMTVAHTARKQHKNVLEFLTACCQAQLADAPPPSLFAAQAAAA
jgi:transposase